MSMNNEEKKYKTNICMKNDKDLINFHDVK